MTSIRRIKIDNNTYELRDARGSQLYVGTCSTAAATNPKVCTVEEFPIDENGKPYVGTEIVVKFDATNTSTSTTPELNVNGTGAIRIWYNNAVLATTKSAYAGYANRYLHYVYDGTYWVFMGHSVDNNSTYSPMSDAEITAGTSTTARLMTPARLRSHFYTEDEVDDLLADKQDTIDDLATIRSGAALGATAIQRTDLATVATSGNYNDLSNKPTIPNIGTLNTNNSTAQTVSSSESFSGNINLHKVSKTGSYNDLLSKPDLLEATYSNGTAYFINSATPAIAPTNYYTKAEIDTKIGDIETLLESI